MPYMVPDKINTEDIDASPARAHLRVNALQPAAVYSLLLAEIRRRSNFYSGTTVAMSETDSLVMPAGMLAQGDGHSDLLVLVNQAATHQRTRARQPPHPHFGPHPHASTTTVIHLFFLTLKRLSIIYNKRLHKNHYNPDSA